jgi:hypothetical protein
MTGENRIANKLKETAKLVEKFTGILLSGMPMFAPSLDSNGIAGGRLTQPDPTRSQINHKLQFCLFF